MMVLRYLDSRFDLEFSKKFLAGVFILILSWVPVDAARTFLWQSHPAFEKNPPRISGIVPMPPLRPLQSYESAFQGSSFFGNASPDSSLTVFKASIHELVKDYRLKGVMMLGAAEAIVEDARLQKSFFVKKGEKLGELTVQEIREGAIVLNYYGEETVLQIE